VSAGLCELPAVELAAGIRARRFSSLEVVRAHLDRIERLNPAVNAIVSLQPEAALEAAAQADRSEPSGPLHGLPIAIKDLEDTAGIRTTYGSPVYRDHVPERDSPLVERIKRAGAIVIGKTNTPEFGAGSQTFNPIFGTTRNPYDLTGTPGGSSGGAAAAVTSGMLPLADGSDLASSVRNPASFCNVVGLRPSPGRVPDGDGWDGLSVLGPIARSVPDAALLLRAMCGADAPASLAEPLRPGASGVRVAWSRDLGDLPVDPEVTAALEPARAALAELGCVVEDAEPDLTPADEAFDVLRAVRFAAAYGELIEGHADQIKRTVVENTRLGLALTGERIARAERLRTEVFHRLRAFLERFEVLALPVAQVPPFPVEVEWVREIAGVPMETYIQWLRSCSRITVTAHPAVSVPAGFTSGGLPVGLQLVGRYRDELGLLRVAAAFEEATGFGGRRPALDG
jgi:amidase